MSFERKLERLSFWFPEGKYSVCFKHTIVLQKLISKKKMELILNASVKTKRKIPPHKMPAGNSSSIIYIFYVRSK